MKIPAFPRQHWLRIVGLFCWLTLFYNIFFVMDGRSGGQVRAVAIAGIASIAGIFTIALILKACLGDRL